MGGEDRLCIQCCHGVHEFCSSQCNVHLAFKDLTSDGGEVEVDKKGLKSDS